MPPLLRELLRPHRRTLAIILAATLVQMLMSLAAPWPLKVHPRQRGRQISLRRNGLAGCYRRWAARARSTSRKPRGS